MYEIVFDEYDRDAGHSTVMMFEDENCYVSVGAGGGKRVVNVHLKKFGLYITGGKKFYDYLVLKAGKELTTYTKVFEDAAGHVLSYTFAQLAIKGGPECLKLIGGFADQIYKSGFRDGEQKVRDNIRAELGL